MTTESFGRPVTSPHPAGPGILAVPAVTMIYTQAVLSMFGLVLPSGSKRLFEFGGTFPDEKRNMLIRNLLAAPELQWIYFCDSDHVLPRDTILRLLETGLDVVGALVYGHPGRNMTPDGRQIMSPQPEAGGRRGHEQDVSARVHAAIKDGLVCEVDWVGGGAMLVRRHVLERIASPWFFRPAEGGEDEDLNFCGKIREAGFSIHLHAGVTVGHIQAVPIGLTA